jgi:hypothetical protein
MYVNLNPEEANSNQEKPGILLKGEGFLRIPEKETLNPRRFIRTNGLLCEQVMGLRKIHFTFLLIT